MNALHCKETCSHVTWDHVGRQFFLAVIPWSVLVSIGVLVTLIAPEWSSNGRKKLITYDCGLASRSLSQAGSIISAHLIQCTAFAIRSSTNKVDTAYHVVEGITTLVVYVDILFHWAYIISRGQAAVIYSAFESLALDCLVATSFGGVMLSGPKGDKTWWSFSFLASLRILRLLIRVHPIREYVDKGGMLVRFVYHTVVCAMWVFGAAMTLMTLEHLNSPKDTGDSGTKWNIFESVLFVVSTMSTVGDTKYTPITVCGRCFTIWLVCWSFYVIGVKVVSLVVDYLSGKNIGLGYYLGSDGHVVVAGSPSAAMLWDFLAEAYHMNHFESGDQFDRDAHQIVVLLPSRTTLRHIAQFLERRDSILFRTRVTLLCGEPSDMQARERAALDRASQIIVLPNLTTADAAGDDSMNIMRTFAITSADPHVPLICLLHSMDHKPSAFMAKDGKTTFVSIDAFKLSLLAKACLVPGVMAFLCNLCKTVGKSEDAPEIWQCQYEEGLDMELYELPLSPAYDNCTFSEIVTDVLARSENGNVYLIGLAETYMTPKGDISRRVKIHPGAKFVVSVGLDNVLDGDVQGVFIATEISDVKQREVGEYALGPVGRSKVMTLRGQMNKRVSIQEGLETPDDQEEPEFQKTKSLREQAAELSGEAFHAFQVKREVIPAAVREHQEAVKTYEVAMKTLGHKMLAGGLDMGVISEIMPQDVSESALQETRLALAGGSPAADGKVGSLRALADETKSPVKPRPVIDDEPIESLDPSELLSKKNQRLTKLRKLHGIQDRMEADARNPPEPPKSIVEKGGHLLLCIVTSTSAETNTEAVVGELGPKIGIEHFMKPLRDNRLGQAQPLLVVLAEELPKDWHAVAEDKRCYFVCGSPLSTYDLNRAGMMSANAIAIGRCHPHGHQHHKKIADARAILATNLIESQFKQRAPPPVITDLAYDASVDFLPMSQTMTLAMQHLAAHPLKRSGGGGSDFIELPSFVAKAEYSETNEFAAMRKLGEHAYEEDYENLETPDYVQHPRFMCGMVFVASAMTALVANTLHNQCLIQLVSGLLQSPFLLLHVPFVWQGQSYADLCEWLLTHRNLLSLGIYRSSTTSPEADLDAMSKRPSLYYMYTAPPAYRTVLCRADRILVIAPTGQ